jgi:hypothetical protein
VDATELANAGDHPALSFLNTRLHPWGEHLDLLRSGSDYLDWMASVGLIDDSESAWLVKHFTKPRLDAAAVQAGKDREWLRGVVEHWAESGAGVTPAVQNRINAVLAADRQYPQLEADHEGDLALRAHRRWDDIAQLRVPVMAAAADLLANADPDLVRVCDGPECEIWFYDRTKAHRRRWCSQAVCGNRDKVRNHRARAQAAGQTG